MCLDPMVKEVPVPVSCRRPATSYMRSFPLAHLGELIRKERSHGPGNAADIVVLPRICPKQAHEDDADPSPIMAAQIVKRGKSR